MTAADVASAYSLARTAFATWRRTDRPAPPGGGAPAVRRPPALGGAAGRCATGNADQRPIDEAEAGQVAVNLPTAGSDLHHPFGGLHESGFAFKEQGAPGLRSYTRIKTTAVRYRW